MQKVSLSCKTIEFKRVCHACSPPPTPFTVFFFHGSLKCTFSLSLVCNVCSSREMFLRESKAFFAFLVCFVLWCLLLRIRNKENHLICYGNRMQSVSSRESVRKSLSRRKTRDGRKESHWLSGKERSPLKWKLVNKSLASLFLSLDSLSLDSLSTRLLRIPCFFSVPHF